MKSILVLATVLLSYQSFAGTKRVFQLYRTNYYAEKTIEYSVKVKEASCEFDGRNPVIAYFVHTSDGRYHSELNAASVFSQNKKYFGPKIKEKTDDYLIFRFRSLNEAAKKEGKAFAIGVELEKKGSKCVPMVSFLNGADKSMMAPFKKMDVEFTLKEYKGFGLQPSGVKWAKIKGKGSRCILGKCP